MDQTPSLNRRQFKRDMLKRRVWVAELDDAGAVLSSWDCESVDLSRSGLGLRSSRMAHPGRLVALEIMDGRGGRQAVLYGVIRQCRYEEGGDYMIGVEFERFKVTKSLERYLKQWKTRAA